MRPPVYGPEEPVLVEGTRVAAQALELGRLALDSGLDGLVCSVHEAQALRTAYGPDPILVTPGIRLPGERMLVLMNGKRKELKILD